jgi:hypothetical protein
MQLFITEDLDKYLSKRLFRLYSKDSMFSFLRNDASFQLVAIAAETLLD